MNHFSRRAFLKVLGLGAVGTATAAPFIFKSEEVAPDLSPQSPLVLPGGEHYVFYGNAPVLEPDGLAYFFFQTERGLSYIHMKNSRTAGFRQPLQKGAREVKRMSPDRDRIRAGWTPAGLPVCYQKDVSPVPDEDPHVTFLIAAMELQDQINADMQSLHKTLGRRGLVPITRTDTPIMAMPKPSQGYILHTELTQFAAVPSQVTNLDRAGMLEHVKFRRAGRVRIPWA